MFVVNKKRAVINNAYRKKMREALKAARLKGTPKKMMAAYQALDRAAKKKVIDKAKAARLKPRLMKRAKKK